MKLAFTRRLRAALLVGALAIASLMVWSGMQNKDSTLEIRASRQGGEYSRRLLCLAPPGCQRYSL
ncbi:Uncharacterised protein [Cedecea neteri]|uniref:Uncharacterized protein n=1 Tax=Cedecea neteri TaxID=158822 RepID=A0A2X2SWX9_9ENTR|nr:Uncharacterised protein [Cedecea neteri]